jgi:type VI secretion system secreted protein VgrG
MVGEEKMGHLFRFEVNLLSETLGISAKQVLGTDLTVEIDTTTELGGSGKRYLSGQVTHFAFLGVDGDFYLYQAVVMPWLWLATRRTDCKIFQHKTVPVIVKEVLGKYGFEIEDKLSGYYREWVYCVQYNESDFQFVSRLLEHEGAYFYFKHQLGSHTLVLADDVGSHSDLPVGPSTIPYYSGNRAATVHDEDFIDNWKGFENIASGRYASDDYDFTKSRVPLDTREAQPAGHNQDSWEVYLWPGGYTAHGDGDHYAKVRMQQYEAGRETIYGEGNVRTISPGYYFTLSKYPDDNYNKKYLIDVVKYEFTENVRRSDGSGSGSDTPTTYRVKFIGVPVTTRYRVFLNTDKPKIYGPQTAKVTGPAGEEIYVDKYGRIKVQFHWDRYGASDENSSCWIRVSQSWAGSNYGTIHNPRIGQEVIIEFVDGDPDYPIVVGRVYNDMQMPPWELPRFKTESGIKTNSSIGGGGKHMLRFEDQKGIEHIDLGTDFGNSHLRLGYHLNQNTQTQRSFGFELRTNEWGSIRADKGLLITAYPQDFTSKISNDNPDGHRSMLEALQQSVALVIESEQAIAATKETVAAIVANKKAMLDSTQSPEPTVPSDMDPTLTDTETMAALSRKVDAPIISYVSPAGHTVISPKPIAMTSGQSISVRSGAAMTLTAGEQFTQLVASGMATQVSSGGQINTVAKGDIVSHALTGTMDHLALNDASITSTTAIASVVGEASVFVQGKREDVVIRAGENIALSCGASSILMKSDGTIVIAGVNGFVHFAGGALNQRGSPIHLNSDEVGGDTSGSSSGGGRG